MLDTLKSINPFQEKRYTIIGVIMGDIPVYEVLVLEKESDRIAVIESFTTKRFDEIRDRVEVSIPVLLNFSGKGIINKKVASEGNYLKEVLFSASPDDFYIYELQQLKFKYISIARKSALDFYFNQFENEKYILIDYSIGPFSAVLIKDILNKGAFYSGECHLIFEGDNLKEFQISQLPSCYYSIDKEKLSNSQVPLFSTLLNHLYPSDSISYNFEFLSFNKQELLLKKIFDKAVVFLGLFFLSALLSSYLLLSYFNNQYIDFESQLYNLNHTYSQVKKLEEEKRSKVLVLQESGVLKENFTSYYIQEIVSSTPREIVLNSLKVNPNNKKIKNFEKIIFESNSIFIEGSSISSLPLNMWVKKLKLKKWIAKIQILNYSNTNKNGAVFSLKINIK
ncbi:hypothetical protein Q4566_00055 [Tamlana sp. 2_MG-2023]|uniref:hypothetical protein n=1 Tax=unclassified Tamlana TaxID=2614803 RepID=UPI0026E3FF4D|nr:MULTISPECIES: hypothetical protein [unclassified Tamlana]MDO6758573.1 hypothetical protein [Tamlana sp. 2_MG-2023]MDO6789272.1 hypothetical protein [Tamlana sp. 1_MG-2023]